MMAGMNWRTVSVFMIFFVALVFQGCKKKKKVHIYPVASFTVKTVEDYQDRYFVLRKTEKGVEKKYSHILNTSLLLRDDSFYYGAGLAVCYRSGYDKTYTVIDRTLLSGKVKPVKWKHYVPMKESTIRAGATGYEGIWKIFAGHASIVAENVPSDLYYYVPREEFIVAPVRTEFPHSVIQDAVECSVRVNMKKCMNAYFKHGDARDFSFYRKMVRAMLKDAGSVLRGHTDAIANLKKLANSFVRLEKVLNRLYGGKGWQYSFYKFSGYTGPLTRIAPGVACHLESIRLISDSRVWYDSRLEVLEESLKRTLSGLQEKIGLVEKYLKEKERGEE